MRAKNFLFIRAAATLTDINKRIGWAAKFQDWSISDGSVIVRLLCPAPIEVSESNVESIKTAAEQHQMELMRWELDKDRRVVTLVLW